MKEKNTKDKWIVRGKKIHRILQLGSISKFFYPIDGEEALIEIIIKPFMVLYFSFNKTVSVFGTLVA